MAERTALEQREVSTAWLSRFVGRTVTVLPTGEGRTGADYLTGKSDEDMIVEVKADKNISVNSFRFA